MSGDNVIQFEFRPTEKSLPAVVKPFVGDSCCRKIHFEADAETRTVKCVECGKVHELWNAFLLMIRFCEDAHYKLLEVRKFEKQQHEKHLRRQARKTGEHP